MRKEVARHRYYAAISDWDLPKPDRITGTD
jgi:hypothetical protein